MRELKVYVMPDGVTRQYWDDEVPEGAVLATPAKAKSEAPKETPKKKATK